MEYELLYPKIHLYKNLIEDPKKLVEMLKESEENPGSSHVFTNWVPWSRFGTYLDSPPRFEKIEGETPDSEKNEKYYLEMKYAKGIESAFFSATNHYMNMYGVEKEDDWFVMGPSYSKYFVDDDTEPGDNVMVHHTDFVKIEEEMPGMKFAITCTMYLNDDYEGGEIDFVIGQDHIPYKPKAGDVLVFPSGHPKVLGGDHMYLHGVKKVKKTNKYLIRCFYQIPYEGSTEWLANQEKYGKEVWAAMEEERIKNGRRKQYDPD